MLHFSFRCKWQITCIKVLAAHNTLFNDLFKQMFLTYNFLKYFFSEYILSSNKICECRYLLYIFILFLTMFSCFFFRIPYLSISQHSTPNVSSILWLTRFSRESPHVSIFYVYFGILALSALAPSKWRILFSHFFRSPPPSLARRRLSESLQIIWC